jgi:hypothetical protein
VEGGNAPNRYTIIGDAGLPPRVSIFIMKYIFKRSSDVTNFEQKHVYPLKSIGNIFKLFKETKKNAESYVILVYDENKIVAWGLIYLKELEIWETHIYVKQKYRRKRIGTKIYNKFKSELNIKNIQIEGIRYNLKSTKFYDKLQKNRT